jgi:2-dehydropantoate 2-reductase
MLQDVEQGRTLELEALLGSVVELARITDCPTPTLDAIYAVTSLLSHTLTQQGGKLALQKTRVKTPRARCRSQP